MDFLFLFDHMKSNAKEYIIMIDKIKDKLT